MKIKVAFLSEDDFQEKAIRVVLCKTTFMVKTRSVIY